MVQPREQELKQEWQEVCMDEKGNAENSNVELKHTRAGSRNMWAGRNIEKYRDIVQVCKATARNAKTYLQLNLVKDVKGNKKGLYRQITSKKNSEDMDPLINRLGDVVRKDMKRDEVLNVFLASASASKISLQKSSEGSYLLLY